MTFRENAKFTCERLVQEYEEDGSFKGNIQFWDALAIIKHSLEINAISKADAERYCYHLHVSYKDMLTA